MKILCERLVQLKNKKLDSFIDYFEKGGSPNDSLEVCVPHSYALDDNTLASIDHSKCTGCLACIDDNERINITPTGVPGNPYPGGRELGSYVDDLFLGSYIDSEFSPRLASHTKKDETLITNPLAAILLWRLSESMDRVYIACSPSAELSIVVPNSGEEREGHLDITIASPGHHRILIMEGKKAVSDLLGSEDRNQWNRYRSGIISDISTKQYDWSFCFVIGGNELTLYPPSCSAPHDTRRNEFYNFITEDRKRFISVEALRALRAYKCAVDPSWTWERWFPALFDEDRFLGIVSGGIVYLRNGRATLERAPWL